MVEDNSLAIGTSFIITKKGLTDAGARNASGSEEYAYLRNPIWWAGISTFANFAAYTFAPPILVTPLGALSVLIGAILASFLLNEELGHLGRTGCALCLIGSLIIVLHAPPDKEVQTVDEILQYAIQPGFMLYCFTVLVFSLVMIFGVAPRYGRSNPLVYISICSLVGSVSVMAIKGFGVAIKLTFGGNNQFTHPSTYAFGIVVIGCILVQMNFFNKALDTFSTNVVNPMYYVGFSTATIVAGRMSLDGWGGISEVQPDGALQSSGHGRRSSIYRAQSTALFNAFEEEDTAANIPLSQLRESEEEYEYDSDEHRIQPSVSRSHSNSPALQGSARNSPRPS
ncbi:magnesium transporter NIPA-domain-containing protein [Suillus lakei]|nr:magnesium transporter NIPA-domain-containing protein [Suillus lakei]